MIKERIFMTNALMEIFIPEIEAKDFSGKFPNFRRTVGNKTNLLTFVFDQYGGGFRIVLANHIGSSFKTFEGREISLDKLTTNDVNEQLRIYPKGTNKRNRRKSWFKYDNTSIFSFGNRFIRQANKAVDRIPVMEAYWSRE